MDARPKPASVDSEPTASKPASATAVSAAMDHVLLRQDGVSYHVPDVATLQRWIVERRVLPTDELDFGGGQWVQAGDRPDLAPFFAIVSEVEVATRKLAAVAVPLDDLTEEASRLDEADGLAPSAPEDLASASPAAEVSDVADVADERDELEEMGDDASRVAAAAADLPAAEALGPETVEGVVEDEHPSTETGTETESSEPGLETPSGRVALSTMVDGDLLADWDDALPETEEAERPPWLGELDEETAIADMDPLATSPTSDDYAGPERRSSADAISTSRALWPEADPPSSPFSKPPVDADGAVSMDEGAPTVVGGLPENAEAEPGLSWADDLFREAPLPGEPSVDEVFDDPSSADDLDEMEIDEPELVGNAEYDSLPIQDEDDGWFAVDGAGDGLSGRRQSPYAGWVLAAIILVMVGGMFWVAQHESTTTNPPPAKIKVKTAGNGAAQTPTPDDEAGKGPQDPAGAESDAGAEATADGAAAEDAAGAAGDEGSGEDASGADAEPAPKKPARPSNTAEAIANRGWRALDRNRVADAEKHFGDALKVDANHAVATYGLAYIAHGREDLARATSLYCRARSLAGSNRELVREVNAGLNKLKASCP